MNKETMDKLKEFFKSVEGRTEDPNSKNPLTKEEMSILAKLRISGVWDEYMEQQDEDIRAAEKKLLK